MSGKDITVGVVVPAQGSNVEFKPVKFEAPILRREELRPPAVTVVNPIADLAHTRLFVDDEPYHDVVAVEFSSKHLLLCVPVRADHNDAVAKLRRVKTFRLELRLAQPDNPVQLTVVEQTLSGFRFDRINYRCNTHHFVAIPTTDRPSGYWIAELRFVAPMTAADGDAEEKAS